MHVGWCAGQKVNFGASLTEPHTSVTALQGVCVCLLVCLRQYTVNLKCVFKCFPKIEHPCAFSR